MSARTKRNPPLTWDWPVEAQNLRQQARFLLMVEDAACGHPKWHPGATLLAREDVLALLADAGAPIDSLADSVGDRHRLKAAVALAQKIPWKQKTPSKSIYRGFKEDKFAIWSFVFHCSQTETSAERRARGDYFAVNHTELEGRHREKLVNIHGPELHLHWRHRIPDCAEELVRPTGRGLGVIGDLSPAAYHRRAQLAEQLAEPLQAEWRRRWEADPMPDASSPEFMDWMKRNLGFDPFDFSGAGNGGRAAGEGRRSAPASASDWAMFNVQPGAPIEQVKTAFRRLAKQHHPDAGGDAEQFRCVVAAYERIQGVSA